MLNAFGQNCNPELWQIQGRPSWELIWRHPFCLSFISFAQLFILKKTKKQSRFCPACTNLVTWLVKQGKSYLSQYKRHGGLPSLRVAWCDSKGGWTALLWEAARNSLPPTSCSCAAGRSQVFVMGLLPCQAQGTHSLNVVLTTVFSFLTQCLSYIKKKEKKGFLLKIFSQEIMDSNFHGPITDPRKTETGNNLSIQQYSKYEIHGPGRDK